MIAMAIKITSGVPMHILFAYIDPGTGSTRSQRLFAGSVGSGASGRLKWNSISALLSRSQAEEPSPDTSDDVMETPDSLS